MTRPLRKPPARSRIKCSQPDLNRISLIDVCAEDDSLLPGKGIASPQGSSGPTPCPRPGASPFKVNAMRTLACIQEDQPESEEPLGTNEEESHDILPSLTIEEPAVKKKKKKSGFNLRKSLAWNNAFFTEAGVLDPDELSLVNRTFKKPLEDPKPASNKKPAFASKILNTSAISKINFSPVRFQKPPSHGENRHHSAAPAQGSPMSSSGSATSKRTDQHNSSVKGSAGSKHTAAPSFSRANGDTIKHVKSMLPTRTELKPSPRKKQTEENPRITSGPSLQARSSSKPPLNQPKQTQSISSTLSSASRMMKDRLGMVFAGRNVGNPKFGVKPAAEDDTIVPSHMTPEYSDSAKLARCYSHSSYERLGRSTVSISTEPTSSAVRKASTALDSRASNMHGTSISKGHPSSSTGFSSSLRQGKEQDTGAFFSHSQGISNRYTRPSQQSALEATTSNSRDTGASETLLSRAKPSGLRMPSPKLGFFDKARTTNATNVAVLRERTNSPGYEGVTSQSARYVGAAIAMPSDVSKQSNSHSYGVIPQALEMASSPITASTHPNRAAKQEKPSILSKNSSQPQLEQGNGPDWLPHSPIAPQSRYFETSLKPEASLALTNGTQSGSCTTGSVPCSYSHGFSNIPAGILPKTQESTSFSFPTSHSQVSDTYSHGFSNITAGFLPKTQESTSLSSHTSGSHVSDTGAILQVKKNIQSNSHSFGVIPQAFKMASSQITASMDLNSPAKQEKPPLLCQPQLEQGNGADGLPHIPIAPQLRHSENSSKPEASLALTSGTQSGPCTTGSVPGSYSHGFSNILAGFLPKTQESTSLSSHTSGSHVSDTGTILQDKKNVQNVFPAVKKMLNKLNLSPLRITQQENLPLEHLQIKEASQHLSPGNEKACSKGDYTTETQEEWPEVKSGAVQHSPPLKEPTKYGPWSPVRRNAPELGPFDCTKYTNTATSH